MGRLKIALCLFAFIICKLNICVAHTIEGTYHHKKLALKQIMLTQDYFENTHNIKPLENLKVYLVEGKSEFKTVIEKHCPQGNYDKLVDYAGALSFDKTIIIDTLDLEDKHIKYYLTHEIVHAYQQHYCGTKYLVDNLWYSEGIADLIAEQLSGFSYLRRQKNIAVYDLTSTKAFTDAIEKHGSLKVYANCKTQVTLIVNPIDKYFAMKGAPKWYPM